MLTNLDEIIVGQKKKTRSLISQSPFANPNGEIKITLHERTQFLSLLFFTEVVILRIIITIIIILLLLLFNNL